MAHKPLKPPYPVGAQVRYTDKPGSAFAHDDKWVHVGDIGKAVKVTDGTPAAFGYNPIDGWTTIEFPSGCRIAITADPETLARYPRIA
jgi:hypothetical protein